MNAIAPNPAEWPGSCEHHGHRVGKGSIAVSTGPGADNTRQSLNAEFAELSGQASAGVHGCRIPILDGKLRQRDDLLLGHLCKFHKHWQISSLGNGYPVHVPTQRMPLLLLLKVTAAASCAIASQR